MLIAVVPSASGAQVKAKPNYRLAVSVSGIVKPTVLGQPYKYVLSVKNTGKKKMARLIVSFDPWKDTYCPAQIVTSASPKKSSITSGDMRTTANWTFRNVPAGATRRITVTAIWPARCYQAGEATGVHIRARTPSKANYQPTKTYEVDF